MRKFCPLSLIFFVFTAAVFALQAIPVFGIFLMLGLAMFWSVALVNAGMIGVAAEAATGRVSRWWLMLPVAFYGGYWAVAAQDHLALRALTASYDAANSTVSVPFDPARQSLVFANRETGAWLTQNYALPVTYSTNTNFPEGHLSHRMMETAICAKVRETPALRAAFVHAFGFHDGEASTDTRRWQNRFCALSMPERPELLLVHVSRQEAKIFKGWLPVTRITTIITTPDEQQFQLLGGVADPLHWLPMPIIGCFLNSARARWECGAQFWRSSFTPIVSGDRRYDRDTVVLARALGLRPVAIEDRKGGDPSLVLAKMAAVEETTLARQLANIDAMIADPLAKVQGWQVGVVTNRPEALLSRADSIMRGLERASEFTRQDRYRARDNGLTLARLVAELPRDRFLESGPRALALYAKADEKHWLWEAEPLLRRLGDLGPAALPYLIHPRASVPSVNGAGIEGLCRVGPAGRDIAEPALVAMWTRPHHIDRDTRATMFVAMRRMGISPPPLPEDKSDQLASLETEWADISPQSPPRVCAVGAERRARQEEKLRGQRRSNLE